MVEEPPIDIENNISDFMNLILSCLFYAPILPVAIPMACIGISLEYILTKFMLTHMHKMPEDLGHELTSFFADLLPYCSYSLLAGYFIFAFNISDWWQEE